jgi:amino acid transporter
VWFTVIEILIISALAISSLIHPGDGGILVRSFTSPENFRRKGLYLAVVFAIFSFTGFESVAPLAEESQNPRQALPRAILLSIALMGVFFVSGSWALLIGWGSDHIAGFAGSAENPLLLLAKRVWGRAWVLVVIAVVNSILGASIAGTNASTRVFYAMARARSLPAGLAYIHPRFRTPVNSILLQTFITLTIGLGLGLWIGPDHEYYFLGIAMTLGLICIYAAGNLGVFVYYRSKRRAEFNALFHVIFPALSTLSLAWVFYQSVVPLPAPPFRYAPLLVAVWLAAGLVLLCMGHGASLIPVAPLDLTQAAEAAPSVLNSQSR